VEPLTAITLIATKYGVSALIGALSGNKDFGGLASELVGTLVASEDRLGEQLGTIGRQLEEVLEQRYSTAIAAGQRTLLDAGTAPDPSVRSAELTRARDLFRDAAASARAPLQVAVAERYVTLCAIALGRQDAARTALGLLNRSALEALLGALPLTGPEALNRARTQLSGEGFRLRRADRVEALGRAIVNAAAEVVPLALSLLKESRVLAEGLGHHLAPEPHVELLWLDQAQELARPMRQAEVIIRPVSPGPLQFGPLSVAWGAELLPVAPLTPELPAMEATQDPAAIAQRLDALNVQLEQLARRNQELMRQTEEHVARIERLMRSFPQSFPAPDVTVRIEPALPLPLRLALSAEPVSEWANPDLRSWPVLGHSVLDAGAREAHLTPTAHVPGEPAEYALIVNDSLVFKTCLPETTPR
jgi:hypothetical protein